MNATVRLRSFETVKIFLHLHSCFKGPLVQFLLAT